MTTRTRAGRFETDLNENQTGHNSGFVEGIQELVDPLRRTFWSILANSWIDANESEEIEAWWERGIRQITDPEMAAVYRTKDDIEKLRVELNKPAMEIDPAALPYFLRKPIGKLLLNTSVDGRGRQQITDLHTGWNSVWLQQQNENGKSTRTTPPVAPRGAARADSNGGSPYND